MTSGIVILKPGKGWVPPLSELWRYRGLLGALLRKELQVRYKQTALGAAWAVLQPLLTMLAFWLFFGRLAGIPSDGVPYSLFAYCGLVPWVFFSSSLSSASMSLIEHRHVLTKVYFPRMLLPLSSVLCALVDFSIALSAMVVLLAFQGPSLTSRVLALPFFLGLAFLASFGAGLCLSALNARFRDVRHAIPFLIQLWLFVTPVAYPSSLVPAAWRILYGLNPMAGVLEGFRWSLLGTPGLSEPLLAGSLAMTTAFLLVGILVFRSTERVMADLV